MRRSALTPRQQVLRHRLAVQVLALGALAVGVMASVKLMSAPIGATALMSLDGIEISQPQTPSFEPADVAVETVSFSETPSTPVTEHASDLNIRWFNGRPIRPAGTVSLLVTAYSPDARSCGSSADGITASGYTVWTNGFKSVAADPRVLPLGSLVSVPGYDAGEVVPVLDTGGKIKGKRLDVLFPDHDEAKRWGAQKLKVVVWEYADGKGNDFKTAHRR